MEDSCEKDKEDNGDKNEDEKDICEAKFESDSSEENNSGNSENSQEEVELPDIATMRNEARKSAFRGFYLTQKTLLFESHESHGSLEPQQSMDVEKVDHKIENPEINAIEESIIPKIIEDLVTLPDDCNEVEEDPNTEPSEVPIHQDDEKVIENDHDNPGINAELKGSNYIVQQKEENVPFVDSLDVVNTSDEEISELVIDKAVETDTPDPVKKLRISLKDLDTSDDEEEVVEKNKVRKPKKSTKKRQEEQEQAMDSCGYDTDVSDIVVTDMDYYKIRHQSAIKEDLPEFSLSWSPTKFVTRHQSFDESDGCYSNQTKPTLTNLLHVKADEGGDTSDEDFSCYESDFMTLDEFLQAYRTEYDLESKPIMVKITHQPTIDEPSDGECNNTESVRDIINSELSITDDELDDLENDTDVSDIETSVGDNPHKRSTITKEEECTVQMMEHNELQGIVAFITPLEENKEHMKPQFEAENIEFEESYNDDSVMIEELLSQDEKTNIMEMYQDDTDEENFSDLEEDSGKVLDNHKECDDIQLSKMTGKIVRISELADGKRIIEMQNQFLHKEKADAFEVDKSSEDESIEDFENANNENEGLIQNVKCANITLEAVDSGITTVRSSEKQRLKSKALRNRNMKNYSKVYTENI